MPTEDQSEFNVMVRAPLGSSVERTNGIISGMRPKLKALPEVEYVFSAVGTDELQKVNQGQMYVKLKDKAKARGYAEKALTLDGSLKPAVETLLGNLQ